MPNDSNHTAIDAKTFTIGVLTVTACILLVGFVLLVSQPPPAYAIGQSDRGGDYIMLTQQLSTSLEGLIVADAASKRAIMYVYDYNQKRLDMRAGIPLDRLRKPQDRKAP